MTSIDAPTREGATITPETGNNGNTVFNFEAPVSPLATQPDLDLAKEISQSAPSDAHTAFTEVATDVQPKYSTEEIGKGSASNMVDNSAEFDSASAESLAANNPTNPDLIIPRDGMTEALKNGRSLVEPGTGVEKDLPGTSARPSSQEIAASAAISTPEDPAAVAIMQQAKAESDGMDALDKVTLTQNTIDRARELNLPPDLTTSAFDALDDIRNGRMTPEKLASLDPRVQEAALRGLTPKQSELYPGPEIKASSTSELDVEAQKNSRRARETVVTPPTITEPVADSDTEAPAPAASEGAPPVVPPPPTAEGASPSGEDPEPDNEIADQNGVNEAISDFRMGGLGIDGLSLADYQKMNDNQKRLFINQLSPDERNDFRTKLLANETTPEATLEPSSDPGTQRRNELSRKHLAEGLNADEQKEFDNFLNGKYENGVLTPKSDEAQPEGRTPEELAAESARIDQEMRDAALQGKAVLESAPDQGPMSERPTDALLASNPDNMNLDELQSHVDELSQRFGRDELSDAEADALDQYEEVLKTRKDEVEATQQTESVTATTESSEEQKKKEAELQRLKGLIEAGKASKEEIADYQKLLKEESPEVRQKNLTERALKGELKPEEIEELAKLNGEAPPERTAEQLKQENIDAYADILKDLSEGKGFDENGNMTQEMKDKVDNFRKLQVEQSNINAGVDPKDARILAEKALESMSKRKEKELAITKEIRQKLAELTAAEMRLAAVPQLLEQARRRKKETMALILTKEPDVGKGTDEERMQKRTELNSLYMRAAGSKEEIVRLKNSATDLTLQYKENMAYVRRKLGLAGRLETFFKVMDAKVYGMVADTRLNYASLYDDE